MLERIKGLLFSSAPPEPAAEAERIRVATCVLLLEMAHADGEFHDMEGRLVEDLLQRRFDLNPEDTAELIEFARHRREESLDLYQFAQQLHAHFSLEEKLEVMETLWRIVYADGVLDRYEDYLIHRLATLLRLSHRQMIEAKVRVLDEVGRENLL